MHSSIDQKMESKDLKIVEPRLSNSKPVNERNAAVTTLLNTADGVEDTTKSNLESTTDC